ncbi:MAG: NAD(P)-dependent alcohol dehydrogenase [Cyclobacteriaceae bacterium]|nr:NAD(P)-dependent alcohol dehydrogenase [Cyclobacteriaceae bacterium]
MKAVICTKYGSPEVLQLKEVEKPIPKRNEVLIKICATTVTSSDCFVRNIYTLPRIFRLPARIALGFLKPRKSILGMVLSGEVEAAGQDVTKFIKGDEVFAYTGMKFGAYAEYTCLPVNGKIGPKEVLIALKPTNLTCEEAIAIPYGGTLALHFLTRIGKIKEGQNVLIYGASGAVGTSAVQLAKHFGADVTGVCSTSNIELVKSLGANNIIDYTKNDEVNFKVKYDIVFDAVGKRKTSKLKEQCKKALTPNGKYISVDSGRPQLLIEDLILLKKLAEKKIIIPVIDKRYPIEEIVESHKYADKGHKKGNIVITI